MTTIDTTRNGLDFTGEYNDLQDQVRSIMGRLEEMLDLHEEFAQGDVNGLGQINYGNVGDLRMVLASLETATNDITDAVNLQNGGC